MLRSIGIHNYHCFVEFRLDLPRKLLLVGSNGSGKTSLREALYLAPLLLALVELAQPLL